MAGPKLYWDAHNYLSMGLCVGPSPDEDNGDEIPEEQDEALRQKLKDLGLDDGFSIDWFIDPEDFAKALEDAAAWLRKLVAAGLDPKEFHIRTDID